jgi:hypothetical protein
MNINRLVLLTSVLALLAGPSHAGERKAQAPEAHNFQLGPYSGVGYSIAEGDRVRAVVALAEGDTGSPLRVEAVLAPGQRVVLSAIGAKAGPKLTLQATSGGTVAFVGSELID